VKLGGLFAENRLFLTWCRDVNPARACLPSLSSLEDRQQDLAGRIYLAETDPLCKIGIEINRFLSIL
jgi:hypothetical protein